MQQAVLITITVLLTASVPIYGTETKWIIQKTL